MDFPTNFLDKFQDIVSQYPDRTAIVDMDARAVQDGAAHLRVLVSILCV